MARESDDPSTILTVLMYGFNIEIGQLEQAKEDGLEAVGVGQKNGIVSLTAVMQVFLLAIDGSLGLIPDPAETIKGGLTMLSFAAPKSATSILVSILVKPLIQAGDFDGAKTAIDNALDVCEATGHGYAKEELLRLRGEVALQFEDEGETTAETYFERSLELAQERETKFWELRTALSIARLRISQGRDEEGIALLRPLYEWFSDEFETEDMLEAKALLEN